VVSSAPDRARADEAAFAALTDPYRRELHLHCYRMLGSVTDAEDLLQETMTAAWQGLEGFAGRSSLRTWLYRIATNRCLNAIRDSKRRPPAEPIPPFEPPPPSRRGEVTWLQPYPDARLDETPGPARRLEARETVELAFIAALQRLPPRQTAVVVLCDVLDFSTAEAAGMLETSPTAVKGLLQRARRSLDRERPAGGRPAAPEAGSAAELDLAQRFAAAFVGDDIDAVVALLTDDAWLAMPPAPHEYVGPEAIAGFLRASAAWRAGRELRLATTRANTQPAFAVYLGAPGRPAAGDPAGLLVLTLAGARIGGLTRFLDARWSPGGRRPHARSGQGIASAGR
jgi:RNA polymerase sigma-70 factor (ECF subfamily)